MIKLSKNAFLLGLALLAASAFGLAACDSGGGGLDCEATGEYECNDNACHECCLNDHCAADEECSDAFVCEKVCLQENADCSADRGACCDGLVCDVFDATCVADCTDAAGCAAAHAGLPYAENLECNNGVCDFRHCTNDGPCLPGTLCYNGDCVSPPDCDEITSCKLVPGSAVTQQGTAVDFSATAFLHSGALAPGVTFTWASSDDAIAAVDAGEVTGGANTGTATITATVASCTVTCDASVMNYGAVAAADTRVVVIDELAGTPVEGATVILHTDPVTTATTDAQGVVTFTGVAPAAGSALDVTVADQGYGYVTLVGIERNDLIVHVGKMFDDSMAGGYRGEMDFSKIICAPGNPCEAKLGLTGPSIPGNLFNLNIDVLIGELIQTDIVLGSTAVTAPLPGGLVLGLNATWFKQYYNPTGVPGARVAWGLGGKLNLSKIIEIAGPIISGGTENIDIGALVVAILPLFGNFYTSLVPGVTVTPIAKVADVGDLNGDGSEADLRPNYDAFPGLPGGDMVLKVPMDKEHPLTVNVPNMTAPYPFDAVIVVAGALVRDAGLVPLGIAAGVDAESQEESPDGVIDPISMAASDVAGRLPEGQYQRVVVALALSIASLTAEDSAGMNLAGQVYFVEDFTGTLNLSAFMAPATVNYDPATRAVTFSGLTGIDYLHMIFSGDGDSTWQVLAPAGQTSPYTLPDAALVGTDRSAGAAVVGIKLIDGVTYQDIPAFDDQNMADLVSLVKEFVFTTAILPDVP
ncbi:MAG TPA: hypothetical protein PK668_20145 [Myxococcota bacterium]|nr:hypothetical protein [Myxococcota bacterium]HRY96140.1 hypothetical protein [Myxococcota bacterium]